MNEIYRQLLVILHGMWQRRWYALAAAWAVTVAGWGLVATIPDRYNSYARVYIDTQSMLAPLMQGLTISTNSLAQISMMQRTLLSRPNLERVVRMTDMDLSVGSDVEMERLISELGENISISSQGGNLFRIAYEDENPNQARNVVQSLLTIFVEGNLGASRTDLASAQRFIDDQLRAYEKQLEEVERLRTEFRRQNSGFLPGEDNYFTRLENAQAELARLQKEYREAKTARDRLAQEFNEMPRYLKLTTPTGPGAGNFGPATENASLVNRINELDRNLTQLQLRGYTDQHPDVVMTRRMLESAREELRQASGATEDGVEGLAANTTVINPVYDQIQIRLIDADAHLATLESRIREQEEGIVRLEALSQTIPRIQAERLKLERDYSIIREKYEALLNRRETARFAQDIEARTDNIQFRVVDPPEVPLSPSSPNRPLYLTAALMVGLGAGVVVAFIFSQIHTTFSTAERIRDHFNLPVLGTISTVLSAAQRRQHRLKLAMFSVVSAGLFMTFAGLMAVELILKPGTL